jgi:hypothetical protein
MSLFLLGFNLLGKGKIGYQQRCDDRGNFQVVLPELEDLAWNKYYIAFLNNWIFLEVDSLGTTLNVGTGGASVIKRSARYADIVACMQIGLKRY